MTEATLPEILNDMVSELERLKRLVSLAYEMYQFIKVQQPTTPLLARYVDLMAGKKS